VLDLFVNKRIFEVFDKIGSEGTDYLMGEEMIGGLYAGNLFNYYFDQPADKWYTDPEMTEPVTFSSKTQEALMKTVYRAKIKPVLEMDLDSIFGNLYVGALSGYTCTKEDEYGHIHDADCVWLRETEVYVEDEYDATQLLFIGIDPLDDCISNVKIGDVLDGSINIRTLVEGTKLGALFGLVKGDDGDWHNYKTHNGLRVVSDVPNAYGYYSYDNGDKFSYEYVPGDRSSELYQAICDIDAEELFGSGAISTILNEVKDLDIGYLMGYVWTDTVYDTDGVTVLKEQGWYTDGSYNVKVSGIKSLLADFSVNDITSGEASYNSWKIGTLMGLNKFGQVWYNSSNTPATGVIGLLADLTVGDISSSTGFKATIGKWHIGEILECFAYDGDISEGGQQVTFEGTTWRREDGSEVSDIVWYKNVIDEEHSTPSQTAYPLRKVEGINTKIYSLSVQQLLESDFKTIIADWKISEILSLDGTETGIIAKLGNMKVSELSDVSNLQTTINGWYIGEIMGYENESGVWKKNGESATGANAKLYGLKVGDISGGFISAIGDWTLSEILDFDGTETGIIAKLGEMTISELSDPDDLQTTINGWYIGEIMNKF
ncbi:MAG: hypothetical protein J6T42_00005, partial [Clostridia bacterium]|nr:hypothetical protein [Clostridia bacterium]